MQDALPNGELSGAQKDAVQKEDKKQEGGEVERGREAEKLQKQMKKVDNYAQY